MTQVVVSPRSAAQPSTSTTSTDTASSSSVTPLSVNFNRFVQKHIRYLPDYPYIPRPRWVPPSLTTTTTSSASVSLSSASTSSASTTDNGKQQGQQEEEQEPRQPSLSVVSPPVALAFPSGLNAVVRDTLVLPSALLRTSGEFTQGVA
ncbi:hypothetical protein NQ176_g6923 [Zarea fungicola]|uniref:Uncharacterized protein n=1 Tax=Zarea fungicola TaxID=93591 RepID=A0ACC1N328_9HYPO|nr:hypothetical protein NQ176_g6923 [Lecanicillium fungicola]